MLKDYANYFSPSWYSGKVVYPDAYISDDAIEEFNRRIYSVDHYLAKHFQGYSSYYLAVAYKERTQSHLKYNGVYYTVDSAFKPDLLQIMKYFLELPQSPEPYEFSDFMEAYYCNALTINDVLERKY